MKKVILSLFIIILIGGRATAQGMPVYDNTNFISLAKTLVESAKQTSQLLKTVQFLKTQKDNIENQIKGVTAKLSNENFVSRAKPPIVQQAKDKLADLTQQLEAVNKHLGSL